MPEYQFSNDWFVQNIVHWQRLFNYYKWDVNQKVKILEIGCFEGRATVWMLENLIKNPESKIFCIDTFQGGSEHTNLNFGDVYQRFLSNIKLTGKDQQVEIIKNQSHLALASLMQTQYEQMDFIYVDGSHKADDVLSDLILSYYLLKDEGLMICDDYIWSTEPPGREDILNNPKIAIDAFSNIFRKSMITMIGLPLNQVPLIKKKIPQAKHPIQTNQYQINYSIKNTIKF